MCGIAGLFGTASLEWIYPMTSLVKHRGPDGEGIKFFPKAALGHRRLSIVDLSSLGHQPMSLNERYWISYNGEIYNHIEIRRELEKKGHVFQSRTDTEVILHAYLEWGEDCLHHFNGMFAFLLYDVEEEKLWAARDRFGVKPLYYTFLQDGGVALGSEIKQFTVLPYWKAILNHEKAVHFLQGGITDHAEETLFKGVFQLRGGCTLTLKGGSPPLFQSWYQLKDESFKGSFQEATVEFRRLLEDSIHIRLRADVEVGSCLSGGMDSSAIVCLMHQLLKSKEKQKTFTAYSEDPRLDEREYAQAVIDRTGVKSYSVTPSADGLLENLSHMLWIMDEPFFSTSQYVQWTVFKKAHQEKMKVMLNGQGADEILGGYSSFWAHYIYDLVRNAQVLTALKEWHQGGYATHYLECMTPTLLVKPIRQILRKSIFPFPSSKGVSAQSKLQLFNSNLPMLLRYEDRNSMAHSIESRTPFLDYRLVEFILSLPSSFKMGGGTTKKILRESLVDVLPEKIYKRRSKLAFSAAEEIWMTEKHSKTFLKLVEQSISLAPGFLDTSHLDYMHAFLRKKKPCRPFIWRWIVFGAWIQKFRVKI